MTDLVPHPSAFERLPLALSNDVIASREKNVIQQCAHGNEPPIHSTQSLHKLSKPPIYYPVLQKPVGKMSVHNARTPLISQSVLIALTHGRVK